MNTSQNLEEKKQDLSLKLFVVLAKSYRSVMEQVEKDIQSRGLNLTDFAVLELLYHKGEQPLQKIGEKILLSSGSITYVVNKLERKGYLKRKPNAHDKRVTFAVIEPKGYELLSRIFPGHWDKIKQLMTVLDENEKEVAIDILKKLGKKEQ
ncbi:MarR family winged helix-turn-helix transcriptional regulator [Oceanobacillus kapialis]|uniref:MarR family winged helix-turn-helix transcriptional regulator n=1 Tax=Oceanobacillus kapialis TaxID=481353 RepID=UPI00384C0DB6